MSDWFWIALGFLGQALFASRFIVQWICSERVGRSIIPTVFWHISLLGGMVLLTYALWRRDPVFIIGQGFGLFVYARNLSLLRAEAREARGEL